MDRRAVHSTKLIRERSAAPLQAQRVEIAFEVGRRHRPDGAPSTLELSQEAAGGVRVTPLGAQAVMLLTDVLPEQAK
jgi:hypothetical protein